MTSRTYPSTASGGVSIGRRYVGGDAHFEASAYLIIGGQADEPMLTEAIAFEAEVAERKQTHESLPAVDTDLTNTAFGI